MGVVADVIFTVAVIAITPGAVPEFQIRMGNVGSAADRAAMGVGSLGLGSGGLIRTCVEGDGFVLLAAGSISGPLGSSSGIDPPGLGQYIGNIAAEEQEIVGEGNDAEKVVGERYCKKIHKHQDKIQKREDPCFDGDNKEQQEMGIRIHGGIAQEETQIQIGDVGLSAEKQAPDIHQDDTCQIEQIEFKGAPAVFHGPTKGPVAEQGNGNEKKIAVAGAVDQGEGEKTPDLAVENGFPVEAQQGIKGEVSGHLPHKIDNCGSGCNIEHQVGNALITVHKAESLKAAAKVFQDALTPKNGFVYFNRKAEKSLYRICKRLDLFLQKNVLTFLYFPVK